MRRAVDEALPRHVLVIDGGGTNRSTMWGGSAMIVAQRRGLEGVVTNGATRDVEQIRRLRFPVFCSGAFVRGGVRNHEGWVGVPVAVGDVCVNLGDLVIADLDGVVGIAKDRIEAVLQKSDRIRPRRGDTRSTTQGRQALLRTDMNATIKDGLYCNRWAFVNTTRIGAVVCFRSFASPWVRHLWVSAPVISLSAPVFVVSS